MATSPRLGLPEPVAGDSMNVNPPAFATIFTQLDAAMGYTVCTTSTKPTTPYACQLIYLTDTNEEQIWDPVASAWVTLYQTPSGIVAINTTASVYNISASDTEAIYASLTSLSLEGFRDYKVHAEAVLSWNSNYNTLTQQTSVGKAYVRWASGTTVSTANAIAGSNYVEAWTNARASQNLAQIPFQLDGIITTSAAGNYSVGASFNMATALPPGSSSIKVTNTLLYVEKVGV